MMLLDLDDLMHIARRVVDGEVLVRDVGLLESAVARPRTTVFGGDAYPTVHEKAAALMHSVAKNHALDDGNKRLTLAAGIAFYGINGLRLTMTEDEAYDFVMQIATGELDEVADIAAVLQRSTEPRPR
jgi:death on curing protein